MKMNFNTKTRVTINSDNVSGRNISIVNGVITVDGVTHQKITSQVINVTVNGDVNTLSNEVGEVNAHNVGNVEVGTGDVRCGNISGNAETGVGDIKCGNISGNAETGVGDIKCR